MRLDWNTKRIEQIKALPQDQKATIGKIRNPQLGKRRIGRQTRHAKTGNRKGGHPNKAAETKEHQADAERLK